MITTTEASYFVLDGARVAADLNEFISREPKHVCLYRGLAAHDLASVAPYLFEFDARNDFGEWLLARGRGRSWGIFIAAAVGIEVVRLHLRKFLFVHKESGEKLYFRYYDPRVLRVILPTFDAAQLREFFGPIRSFIVEDADSGFAFRFSIKNGVLQAVRERWFATHKPSS